MTSRYSFSKQTLAAFALLICVGFAPQAYAQATNLVTVNEKLTKQFAEVPTLYKQITILAGIISVMMGVNGFYKGLGDPRGGPAPVKNGSLIAIGGMLLYISYMALVAEKSFFGTNATGSAQIRKSRTTTEMSPFQ
jgi:hypothetical protein